MSPRRIAIWFLLAEAVGGAVWWCLLLGWPARRADFMAKGSPDAALLAFSVADFILYIGAATACAFGLWTRRRWAWPLLCVHAGAAAYAALYCWTLVALTGGNGLLGAVLMTPSLFIPGSLVWFLRPTGDAC